MRIRIAPNFLYRYQLSFRAGTMAENISLAKAYTREGAAAKPWFDTMMAAAGTWMEVETEHLFEDQFNTESARVDSRYLDGIDFSPEFPDVQAFLEAVQRRYDVDWPGSKVVHTLERRINLGSIEDLTPTEACSDTNSKNQP